MLALGGHMISETESFIDPVYYDYAALGVATGVLALVTIPVMSVEPAINHTDNTHWMLQDRPGFLCEHLHLLDCGRARVAGYATFQGYTNTADCTTHRLALDFVPRGRRGCCQ